MSGIGVTKEAAGDIEDRVEKSDEAVAGDAAAKQPVDRAAQFIGSYRWRCKSAHGGLQIRHQKRGGHSFSCYVRDAEAQCVFVEAQHVVIISADDSRGAPVGGDGISRRLR